jgi:DNA uptake protein ComE-like DNA-binding protein
MLCVTLAGCTAREEDSAAYAAACHGPPLRSIERRDQALQDGYALSRSFDCIDRTSYLLVQEQKAREAAARSPEAQAQQRVERERLATEQQRRAAAADAEALARQAEGGRLPPLVPVVPVDVNTADEAALAALPGLDREEAARIVEARAKRRFADWSDLVARVDGLRAARNAVFASVSGLTVNGESLPGAGPDPMLAAALRARRLDERPR